MRTDIQAADSVGPQVEEMKDVRKAVLDKAQTDFRAAMEKARLELKDALEGSDDGE
ncbi:hypothetical protein JW899_02230 [Candidatus Uhrbacteria bacterium]|nr:hypothetical protein [Candidatus Uhrbacteria bacterium]